MLAGVGKVKVAFKKTQLPLWGYGRLTHMADGSETDLFARAFVLKDNQVTLAIVIVECYLISHHLKKEVLRKLHEKLPDCQINDENLLICAQNTHSAPGGYSHYPFLNLSTKGFRRDVFNAYADATFKALQAAIADLSPSKLFLNVGEMPPSADVAFNRSLDAYNANPEVEPCDENSTHLALDRMMKQIRIEDAKGVNKGLINWFGVQGTSISAQNTRIHSDNKGYAASLLENDQSDVRSFVAGFACDACADVSPNYHGRGKWWPRGRYEDEFKSAYFNGFFQFERSKQLMESAEDQIPLQLKLDFDLQYYNLSSITCSPDFTPDREPHVTGQAAAGLALLDGSPVDNPGIDSLSSGLVASWVKYRNFLRTIPIISSRKARADFKRLRLAQGPKRILAELQEKKVLGFSNLNKLRLPPALSDISEELKRQYNNKALSENTWIPVVVPVQVFVIGEIAIAAFPGEITTVAGMRLRKSLLEKLHHRGIIEVLLTSNANEYMGYTTTFEEYQQPTYERGMTFYGHYTLAAMQTCFNKVAENLLLPTGKRKHDKKTLPPDFSEKEINARSASQ